MEMADELTLSQASVSRIVDKLLEGGLVHELAAKPNGFGRPQVPLAIRAGAAQVATVDIRRDYYRLRLADLSGGLLAEAHAAVQAAAKPGPHAGAEGSAGGPVRVGSAREAVGLVLELLSAAQRLAGTEARPSAFVVGVSAAWDHAGRRVYAARNLPYLEGVDLRALVEESLAAKVRVINDVKLAALGELGAGTAEGLAGFYYLSLGSGVAGASVLDGRVLDGRNGFAGEVGYLRVRTAQGRWTDLETVVARGRVEERWRSLGGSEPLVDGLARAPAGPDERAFRSELTANVLAALTAVVTLADPPLIVLGGSLGIRLGPLLGELRAELGASVPRPPAVEISRVGADAALLGGIRLGQELARAELLRALLD